MWDWRQQTSGAGYREAPRYFRINPRNHSGRRLYSLIGPGARLLVTESCRELVSAANRHGTPDPEWLRENLQLLDDPPFDLLLVCGKVAQATFTRCDYTPRQAPVMEIPHPAARTWTRQQIDEIAARIQVLRSTLQTCE